MITTVITGTTNGIGLITARELARNQHHLLMLCRNMQAARALAKNISTETSNSNIIPILCDLSSLESIINAVRKIRQEVDTIDLLINNAGMISPKKQFSADGFELTIAVNHLGPFFLARSLESLMQGGQIINLASKAHFFCKASELFAENDFRAPGTYATFKSYARSKLANILFSFFYAKQQKSKIACHCLHPGSIGTNIVPTHNIFSKGLNRIWQIIGPSPKRGAKTTLHLALAPRADIQSGLYWENAKPAKASNAANSEALQKTCWDQSNRMVGLI
ncbi:SDR family NAD(P)-dependent oxidoreductase [Gammaproteobacteria bacterium]|nr:SDR family NAD(P)-dependent oxidoreductase [Gammaproteobacteria bacterium]